MTGTVRGTPGWLRATNDRTALGLLLQHGPLTRNRLGELSGLSKPTAAQMVARLEEAGLIRVDGEISGGRGPNAVSYAVRADRVLGVAIDVSSSRITATVVDATGAEHPVAELLLAPDAERTAVSDVRGAIAAACAAAGIRHDAVRLVCIGVQAAVAQRTDELSFTDTLPGWPTTGIRAHLERELGVAVTLDNDANLAAVAERAAGSALDVDGFALLWMGEGLGLAIDVSGRIYRGAAGGSGEIGYLPVPAEGQQLDPEAPTLTEFFGGAAWARLRDAEGTDAVAALAERVALGLVPVLAVLDPERIVLGGPTGREGGERLASLVSEQLAATTQWRPDVVVTAVPDHPVLRGAREVLIADVHSRLFDDVTKISS